MPIMLKEKWDSAEEYVESLTHWAAYVLFAREFVSGREVLEIGCGYGYGADNLSESASSMVAVDIAEEHILYCRAKYGRDNLDFLQADGLRLPFRDDSFDVVLSFQVMEHIEPRNVLEYLSEIRRVLRRGGIFLVATPNSRMRLLPFQRPWNPEHKKEYKDSELGGLLGRVFERVKVYGLCSSSEEILALEYQWKKHGPFRAYIVPLVLPVLSRLLPSSVLIQLKKMAQRLLKRPTGYELMPQEAFMGRYSLNDFRIDSACPRDCIDLYGVGTKAER
ncbi:MAG: class I SAM-dependent methyltransferase [Chloroflexi bacterium]|nr:class I SAM-dependent methyltransferase [Chloroflexota bacterium]